MRLSSSSRESAPIPGEAGSVSPPTAEPEYGVDPNEHMDDVKLIVTVTAGAVAGAVLVPGLVLGVTAASHWLRYGSWIESWGLVLAIQAVPIGIGVGAVAGWFLHWRRSTARG